MLSGGRISEVGTFRELLARQGKFAEILKEYLFEHTAAEEITEGYLCETLSICKVKYTRALEETSETEEIIAELESFVPGIRTR